VFHLDSSFICWFRIIRALFCVFWVFIAEDVDGLEEVSGDTMTVDLQILLEVFMNISLRSACFSDKAFFW
jgi:hypothetical protein